MMFPKKNADHEGQRFFSEVMPGQIISTERLMN